MGKKRNSRPMRDVTLGVDAPGRPRKKPVKTIGRRAIVQLPELGITQAIAKVDTGAYNSTMHVENIRIETHDNVRELVFDIVPLPKLETVNNEAQTIRTTNYFIRKVRSSNGIASERYMIQSELVLGGLRFPVSLTLSDRSVMRYPILLGRKALRSRFIVNVQLDEKQADEELK